MVLTPPYVSPSGRSSEIVMWPAAERLVYGTAPKYGKAMAAPPSTRAMRLRAGTELPRAVTPGQDLRAVPLEAVGQKASAWDHRLQAHFATVGRPRSATLRRPRSAAPRVRAATDGRSDAVDVVAPESPAWEAAARWEVADGDGDAEATPASPGPHAPPPPPAAIRFAWKHPQVLLRDIASGRHAWGPREQKVLDAYIDDLQAPPSPSPSAARVRPHSAPRVSPRWRSAASTSCGL